MASHLSSIDRQANARLRELTGNGATQRRLVGELVAATHPRLRHPLTVYGYGPDNQVVHMPINPKAYLNAVFRVHAEPPSKDDPHVTDQGIFGYAMPDEFRRIGTYEFMRLDEDGNVLEVSFASIELLREFTYHLLGRDRTDKVWERIVQIQEAVFTYLRSRPEWMAQLEEFVTNRGWPQGLADEARLAYFDAPSARLIDWAAEKGYTNEEMWLAGWFDMNFRRTGEVSFSVRDTHVIRIPYFRDGHIEVWRTRNLREERAQTHKYTSWPLNRSIDAEWRLEHRLYNSWRLSEAKGKTLVITEGEFKCLVGTHTGPLTVGIPGITEVDDRTIEALVKAKARRYIVVLDRDPVGKGMMRVDGITDSQRAAYLIATRLREAGARNVLVGIIPDVRDGEKVGLDDLILDKGPEAYTKLINTAMRPWEYARHIGLSMVFCNLIRARQQLRKALEHYENSIARGGALIAEATYTEAKELCAAVNELFSEYLDQRFMGARRIDQPYSKYVAMYRMPSGVPLPERKLVLTEDGRELPLELFMQDILNIVFNPRGAPEEKMFGMDAQVWLPFSQHELYRLRAGQAAKRVKRLVARGAKTIGADEALAVKGQYPLLELATMAVIGQLDYWFPADEYRLERNLQLLVRHEDYWDKLTEVPIAVFRKSTGVAVAFVAVVSWSEKAYTGLAMDAVSQARTLRVWFMRNTPDENTNARERYKRFTSTLWPYWFERNLGITTEVMARFGVNAETVAEMQLMVLRKDDLRELTQHLEFRRALNQSTQAGILKRFSNGKIRRRFQHDVVLIPVRDEHGGICALRVLPLHPSDQLPPALPPQPRIVRHLYGEGKYLLRQFYPERHLYLKELLPAEGAPDLIVAYHELDGLALLPGATPVVALNSSLDLSPDAVQSLANSGARTMYVVASGGMPASRYDAFSFEGLPGFIKEVYDLSQAVKSALPEGAVTPEFKVFVTSAPLTQAVRTYGPDPCQQAILAGALPFESFLRSHAFNADQHGMARRFLAISSRFMDYLELLALPDLLDSRPVDWYMRQSERYYLAIQLIAEQQHGVQLPSVEEYFARRLKLDEPVRLSELLRRRQEDREPFIHRPVYGVKEEHVEPDPGFLTLFDAIMHPACEVDPPRNVLSYGSTRKRIGKSTEGSDMLTNPKSVVLQFLARHLRNTPPQDVQFTATSSGFECRVSVAYDGNTYLGSGRASTKKEAEKAAYHVILSKMTGSGLAIEGADSVDAPEAEEPGEAGPTLHYQSDVTKALDALKMDAGDKNYIGCLMRFTQAARLTAPTFTVEPVVQEKAALAWKTVGAQTLADGTVITSDEHTDTNKKASQQKAAGDLISRIWHHYEQ